MKKRFELCRLTPPGLSAKLELSWAAALLVPILLWHAVYWIALLHARNDLFLTVDGKAEVHITALPFSFYFSSALRSIITPSFSVEAAAFT